MLCNEVVEYLYGTYAPLGPYVNVLSCFFNQVPAEYPHWDGS